MKTQTILGTKITDATEEECLHYLFETLLKSPDKAYIVTPNPEMLVHAEKNHTFKAILNNAALALPDGIGVMIAAKLLGKPLKDRITGTDFLKSAAVKSAEKHVSIGLLGGKGGVAEKTSDCLQKIAPGIKIAFTGAEWPGLEASSELKVQSSKLQNVNHFDILFVAFGHPKQEQWITDHLDNLPVKVAMGVGGAFDYISGEVVRAPLIIRKIGFEWLFRLIRQPKRLRRIIWVALIQFSLLIIKERFKKHH